LAAAVLVADVVECLKYKLVSFDMTIYYWLRHYAVHVHVHVHVHVVHDASEIDFLVKT
jgi:hypothetical protein